MDQTPNWYVITGGPSSGKTSLINQLKHRGYKTSVEGARHYIDLQKINGRDIEEIRLNQREFQHKVMHLQITLEHNLDKQELIFLDRALPDTLAYDKFLGLESDNKLREELALSHYKKIFILDLLPLHPDYARTEDVVAQRRIQEILIEVYRERGEPILSVPVLDVEARADFVLRNL